MKNIHVKKLQGLHVVIKPEMVTLLNLNTEFNIAIDLDPDQARFLGLYEEAMLAEEMGLDNQKEGVV